MSSPVAVVPPIDLAVEAAVLGAALVEPEVLALLTARLQVEDFYTENHRVIFKAISQLAAAGQPVDALTVEHCLRESRDLDVAGGSAKLSLLGLDATIPAHIPRYVEQIIQESQKRQLVQQTNRLARQAQDGARACDLLEETATIVEALRKRSHATSIEWPLQDAAEDWPVQLTEFAVEQLLPLEHVVWWGGLPKRGKSLLLLAICLAIACKRETFACHFKITRHPKILYVSREDGAGRIQERKIDILAGWGQAPAPGAFQLVIRQRVDLTNPAHVTWLRETCLHEAIELLVLDTLTALSPTADPLGARDQAMLAATIVQLAEDIKGTVVVVDHSRKNRPEGQVLSSADIFGPPQKWAAAEHIVMLGATKDPRRIEVFIEGKDVDSDRFFLAVSPRGSKEEKFLFAGSAAEVINDRRAKGEANRKAVLDAVLAKGSATTVKEVVATLAAAGRVLSHDTVQRHLTRWEESGRVSRHGAGKATSYSARAVAPREPCAEHQGAANG